MYAEKTNDKPAALNLTDGDTVVAKCTTKGTRTSTYLPAFLAALKHFRSTGSSFEVNQFVLGQMKGYPPWPARIQGFTKDGSKLKCYFFGTHNTGSVDRKKAIPFGNAYNVVRLISLSMPSYFIKAVREVEALNGVPESQSSLNELHSIQL